MSENFLEVSYKTDNAVKLSDMTDGLSAMNRRYKSFVHQRSDIRKQFDQELYLSGVRHGSQIFELIPVAIIGALPLLSDMNTVLQFQTHLAQMLGYFEKKSKAPQKVTPKVCEDALKILEPARVSNGGVSINAVEGNVTVNNYYLSPEQTERISNQALKEKLLLEQPDIEIIKGVKFNFIQSRTGAAKTVGFISPDKGTISSIDSRSYSVLFDEEIEEYKYSLMNGDENFFGKDFLVDVEIIRVQSKIKAYKLLSIKIL